MLLTVLAATVIFLLQGRNILLHRADQGEQTRSALVTQSAAQSLALAEALLENENSQATVVVAEAAQLNMADELAASRNQVATAEADLATAQATLAAQKLAEEAGPRITIFAPEDGARVPPKQPFDILVTVIDPHGVAAVELNINETTVERYAPQDQAVFTFHRAWTPGQKQNVAIRVTAVNGLGRAGAPQRITVTTTDQPDANALVRARVEAAVQEIRSLGPTRPITPTLLSRAEFAQRLTEDFEEDLDKEELADTTLALYALNFVPRDFDLYNTYLNLYSAGVTGFYDSETNEFVVISEDDQLSIAEQTTHAHEFMHALQDQHFSLDELGNEGLDSEADAALRALAEGEARFVENRYINDYLTPTELRELYRESAESSADVPEDVPQFLLDDLLFPYTAGLEFVTGLYSQGGFGAINAAWADPPRSTEQILHPELYLAGDAPQLVSLSPLTATLGAGWRRAENEILGEFYLREYLAQALTQSVVNPAATGWGGDRLAVYHNRRTDELVMVLRLAWDTPTDSQQFAAAYAQYAARLYNSPGQRQENDALCWLGEDVTCLSIQSQGDILIVRAPGLESAEKIIAVNGF